MNPGNRSENHRCLLVAVDGGRVCLICGQYRPPKSRYDWWLIAAISAYVLFWLVGIPSLLWRVTCGR